MQVDIIVMIVQKLAVVMETHIIGMLMSVVAALALQRVWGGSSRHSLPS